MSCLMHKMCLLCRCLPSFDTAILNDIVSADAPATSVFVSTSSSPYHQYLDSAGQRLDRCIADIQKGFAVIVVSGAPVASVPKLPGQFHAYCSESQKKRARGKKVLSRV